MSAATSTTAATFTFASPRSLNYEVSLLRLIEKVTNGTVIEISLTGTAILVKPGIISGGPVVHECPLSRSVGYFLEPIIMFAPFSKKPLALTLRGITTDDKDLSVRRFNSHCYPPSLEPFGISDGLELKIKKRGSPPLGGGEVLFHCPIVKQVKTLNFVEPGKIKRIRGISHAVRVSPQFSNRMIEAARSVLNRYIPDIYLYSDVYKGEESGKSPGYALSLVAESTTAALHCAEAVSQPGVAPEDIALQATRSLLNEIERGGCVTRNTKPWMLGVVEWQNPQRERDIQFLRDVKDAFGTSFKIVPADKSSQSSHLLYSCYGTGYVNTNRSLA
ncbi:18S rRNA biogenesis protein [Russula vinacea]|nr:18S rRNA biogenesis protein [Russula vinacea]